MSDNAAIPTTSHGTAVQVNGKGILLRGASGSGKSSIAMRLLDECRLSNTTGFLIADDRICVEQKNNALFVSAPDNLRGLMEIRGLGIVAMKCIKQAKLDLVVDLVPEEFFERYPQQGIQSTSLSGMELLRIHIEERNPDAAAIIRTYLHLTDTDNDAFQIET